MAELEIVERDWLKISIVVDRAVEARYVATVLTVLDRAFSRFVRDQIGVSGARLVVVRTGVGSWWAYLAMAKEMYDLAHDHPDLVPVFINNVDVTYRSLVDHGPADTAKYLRDLVRDLARVAKRIGADAIDLAGIVRVTILAEHYDLVLRPDEDEAEISLASNRVKTKGQGLTLLTDAEKIVHAGELASSGTLMGTAFLVDGSWYARAEGMGGILLPLTLNALSRLTVQNGVAFQIQGSLLRSVEGYPVGIAVDSLTHL